MSQRHATDVVSLVFAIIFGGATVVWLVDLGDHLDRDNAWWMGPLVLVVAGVAGLVAALRPDRSPAEPTRPDDDPEVPTVA